MTVTLIKDATLELNNMAIHTVQVRTIMKDIIALGILMDQRISLMNIHSIQLQSIQIPCPHYPHTPGGTHRVNHHRSLLLRVARCLQGVINFLQQGTALDLILMTGLQEG